MSCFSHSSIKGEAVRGLSPTLRNIVARSAANYCQVAPNADLGEASSRENLRSAFFRIRNHLKRYGSLQAACQQLDFDAHRLADC